MKIYAILFVIALLIPAIVAPVDSNIEEVQKTRQLDNSYVSLSAVATYNKITTITFYGSNYTRLELVGYDVTLDCKQPLIINARSQYAERSTTLCTPENTIMGYGAAEYMTYRNAANQMLGTVDLKRLFQTVNSK